MLDHGGSHINREGRGRFKGYGAGSHPVGAINAGTLDLLRRNNYPVGDLRSKDWAEFSAPAWRPSAAKPMRYEFEDEYPHGP